MAIGSVEQGRLSPADVASFTGEKPVFISPVTIAELKYEVELASTPALRQKRRAALNRLQRKPLLTIDAQTGEVFGDLAAHVRRAGRHHRYRVQDLWLASQTVQHGYRLLTRNSRNFTDIPGLDLTLIP